MGGWRGGVEEWGGGGEGGGRNGGLKLDNLKFLFLFFSI